MPGMTLEAAGFASDRHLHNLHIRIKYINQERIAASAGIDIAALGLEEVVAVKRQYIVLELVGERV